jgi:hypothetical protein
MLSRALSLATVTLLVGCFTAGALLAVENLEAGKTPSQIFSGTCNACHKSPRGLLKTVPASSLPGFLRQHYTTSSDMASVLSSFLISNGATDTRFQSKDQPKGAKQEAKPEQLDRFGRRQNPAAPPTQEASRPDADGITPQDGGRPGRDGKRRPGHTPDAARPDGQAPVQAATDSKMGAKQKLGKRGKPAEEPPKTDEAAKEDSSKTARIDAGEKPDAAKPAGEGKSDTAKVDGDKPDAGKPETSKAETSKPETSKPETGKSETAKVDAPREAVGSEPTPLRPDPVPPVTPAPPASAASTAAGTPEPAAIPNPSPPAPPISQ